MAQRDVKGLFEDACLVGLEGGLIPSSSGGDVVAHAPGGKATRWTLATYSPEEFSYVEVTVEGNKTRIERTNFTSVFVNHRKEIDNHYRLGRSRVQWGGAR